MVRFFRNSILTIVIIVTVILSSGFFTAVRSQGNVTLNGQENDFCNDDAKIKACPKKCYEKCRDTEFYLQHQESCKYVLTNKNEISDSEECLPKGGRLNDCLGQLKVVKSDEIPQGEEFEWVRVFLKDKPDCAADVRVLSAMNNCLINEGKTLEDKLNKLKEKGYTDAENIDAICKYSKEQFLADLRLSKEVENEIQTLLKEFDTVNSCNQDFKQWIEKKDVNKTGKNSVSAEGCQGDPVCIANVTNLSKKLREDLNPVTEKQAEMKLKLDGIKRDSKSMQSVFGFFIIYGCN